MRPSVSVVITNFNYGQFLGEAIGSALAQDYENTEVIVVDDGSTDDSHEVIQKFGKTVTPLYKANGGQGSAFNAGFAAATGEIICLLDADDAFTIDKVTAVVESLEAQPSAQWHFHALEVTDDRGVVIRISPPSMGDGIVDLRADVAAGRLRVPAPATSGLSFRRALLATILPMPELPGILLSDNYIKLTAISAAPGLVSSKCYGRQRVHGLNAYTGTRGRIRGEVALNTAYWLNRRGHHLSRISSQMVAVGVGWLMAEGILTPRERVMVREMLASLPACERLRVVMRSQAHAVRTISALPGLGWVNASRRFLNSTAVWEYLL